ncbi:uncharacterized protein [Antedon mediterranea]|uniref:uncharacterized protein n=1 Tax=Antedon mediterranea TaxID=105859 RepID=UPI003AF6F0C2
MMIIKNKGCDNEEGFTDVLRVVKTEVERRKSLGRDYLKRKETILKYYTPLNQEIYKLQISFLSLKFLKLVEHSKQKNASMQSLIKLMSTEKGERIYSFPIFTEEFCNSFKEEIEHFENTDLPKGRPNTMNNYGEKSRPSKRDRKYKGITFPGINWGKKIFRQKFKTTTNSKNTTNSEVNTETPAKAKDVSKKSTAEGTEDASLNVQQSLDKYIIQEIFSKQEVKQSPLETFNIWDHGGQLIYQGIHQIFVTSEAVYVAVFDLSKDLDDPALVIDPNGQEHEHHWTNRQFLLSSILSVYSHSRILGQNIEKEVNLPAILVVGTHKASLGETEEEQNKEAEVVLQKVKDSLKGKPYEKHVLGYYAVENSRETTDKSFSDLKKVIQDLMNHLKKSIPLKWMRFRCEMYNLRKDKMICSAEEVKEMARQNGIGDESQQLIMLNFLYDLGDIIYLPDNELLQNQVVLDPMSLVQFVTAFVTVVTPDEFKTPMFREAFRNLDKGILGEKLLKKLWKKKGIDDKKFKYLVDLMIRFGFICERTESTNQASMKTTSTERSFFVPLRLAFEKPSSEVKSVHDEHYSISIYYDLCGHLPDILFPYLVIDFINKYQKKPGNDPILSHDYAKLYIDQCHNVIMSLVKFITKKDERKFLLKATIIGREAVDETATTECEPSPEACKQVMSTIEMSFKHSKDGGRRGFKFQRCIPCVCSKTSEKKHMQILRDFQDEMLSCKDVMHMNIKRYKRLFGNTPDATTHMATSSSSETSLNPLEDKLNKLNYDLSEVFMKNKRKFLFLRCCLFDEVDLQVLGNKDYKANDYFNELADKGKIKPTDVNLLLEVATLSEIKHAKDLVKQYMNDNNVHISNQQKLSPYRKRLCKALEQFNPSELNRVTAYYQLEQPTIWDVTFYLESKSKLVDESEREKFAELLGPIPNKIMCNKEDDH